MRAEPVAFAETPIYSRLVAERGDVPARTRDEADRLHRLLEQVFSATSTPAPQPRAGQQGFFGAAALSPRALPPSPAG
ncbi:hypothetical protein [Streptomyces phaeochromogenes]